MSRSTIFSLIALIMGALHLLLGGHAQAAWTEDFESYPPGLLTSAPWDQGSVDNLGPNQIVTTAAGYLGGQGLVAVGDNFGSLGNAWRGTDSGADVLTARLYSDNTLSPNNSRYYIGFWNSADADGGHHANDDYLAIYLTSNLDGAGNFFSFEYSNFDGLGGSFIPPVGTEDRADLNGSGILGETWYDVRITLNGDDTATGEFRQSAVGDSGAWTLIGDGSGGADGDGAIDIVDPAGFNPNFVGFRGGFNARLDDINVNGVGGPPATEFTWDTTNLGDWASPNNWTFSTGSTPNLNIRANGLDHTAIFADAISGPTTVSTHAAVTLNRIEFNNTEHSYFIAGQGSVSLGATETPCLSCPSVSVTGTHQFQAVVNLLADTTINVASDSTLSFNNALELMGNTLIKLGDGTMAINNKLTTAGGMVDVQQGTISGNGTIGGDVDNAATISPGNSPGILTIDGNYTQGGSGTLALEIGGLIPGEEHDKLVVNGIATLDGTLDVTLINGFTLAGDMLFDVLDFNSVVSDFSTFNLPPGLNWDVSDGSLCFGTCTGGGLTDYDNDGTWGLGDLNLVLFNWNEDGATLPAAWMNSRPSAGTLVGLPELNQVLFSWGQPGALATVPEPGTLVLLLGLVALAGVFRRR